MTTERIRKYSSGAERLRVFLRLCGDQGITQQMWAVDIGLKNEHLSRLANGARQPSMAQAWHIEQVTRGFVTMQHWMQPGAEPAPRKSRRAAGLNDTSQFVSRKSMNSEHKDGML